MQINTEKTRYYQMGNCTKLPFSQLKQIVPHRLCEIVSGGRRHLLLFLSTPSCHITEQQRQETAQGIQLHDAEWGHG